MQTFNKHPYPEYINQSATKLIIGTLPPARFCLNEQGNLIGPLENDDVKFYYGSKDNYFWPLISSVTNKSFDGGDVGIQQRKKFLDDNNIGITDIIEQCLRNGTSAKDEDLHITEDRSIIKILNKYPKIDTLIYTSEKVKSLICKNTGSYHRKGETSKKKTIILSGKSYSVIILFSPSPRALQRLKGGNQTRIDQYQEVFKNDK